MEETLIKLGLTLKEAKIYLKLLEQPHQTAADVAVAAREKRTNVYMLLDNLVEKGLAEASDKTAVREYSAADPSSLNKLLQAQQERQQQAQAALSAALPRLKTLYSLASDKPGVVHMAGMEGFKTLLDDMIRSKTEVLLVASNDLPVNTDDVRLFRERLVERKSAGVKTRALFHLDERRDMIQNEFAERGIETRFLGEQPFKGEVVIYEHNVAFTVYEPSLTITVITNEHIGATMRTLFEELWEKAK